MDWATEPNPFRRYEGTELNPLQLLKDDPTSGRMALYLRTEGAPKTFDLENISAFLELSMGLSAWKSYQGTTWSLRMNPSSGNLHPTEAHIILPRDKETSTGTTLGAGIFHYTPYLHALERRATIGSALSEDISTHFGRSGFMVSLASIYWRESWKYGERAFRYVNLNVGHAVAAMAFSAALLGWRLSYLPALTDHNGARSIGLNHIPWKTFEEEYFENLLYIHPASDGEAPLGPTAAIVDALAELDYTGVPNTLSKITTHDR